MIKAELNRIVINDDQLYARRDARTILGGVSDATLRRMEKAGRLKAVKLNKRAPHAQSFYRGKNLRQVIAE